MRSALRPVAWPSALLVLALVLSGCGSAGDAGGTPAETRTVQVSSGTVEVPADPERVAVLWRPGLAAVTELGVVPVATLGDPARGDSGLAPYLPESVPAEALTVVSNTPQEHDVNMERLAATRPDLIIGVDSTAAAQAQLRGQLEEIAPTVLLDWPGPTAWRQYLGDVAAVLGMPGEGERALRDYAERVAAARERLGDTSGVEVSLVRLQSDSEVRFETTTSFPGEILDELGFARPKSQRGTEPDEPFVSESYERLAEADADVVFVFANQDYEDAPTAFGDGVWANISAVREDQVFAVDYDYWGAASLFGAERVLDDVVAAMEGDLRPAV
ncbi:iron-siderophore ABC transporter substrate-binding protein [Marinitenerispora sediminis]|uniref:ABC transporter substrate-binding protein n=1 Tax=Marinitenerispora sediminis TaxID=1931232 RepID=A0A368T809_9ACTN|nr:iron-siderophore ABC transporter substrate-binding protein [Marinitenerispora sediminis]RCV56528.1 ABC transporter substrate-binding protein [Marinitenerispora sediminis]RCV60121.1 ABC transporter substrate-binding protein [Marinitenerispora sediminis]RCV60374.1 ABC transporter substrate-binding protein [Marinitenerispora sediminis]